MAKKIVREWRLGMFVSMIGALIALIGNLILGGSVIVTFVAAAWFVFSFWVLFVPHEEIPANLAVESLKIPDDRGFEKE